MNTTSASGSEMGLGHALSLFRRLGVVRESLSEAEFNVAYYRLARRFHPDINPQNAELMANINRARQIILATYRKA